MCYDPDIIMITDDRGTILFVSSSFESVSGFTPEELYGRNADNIIHAEDLGRCRIILKELIHKPSDMPLFEFRVRHKEKGWVCLEAWVADFRNNPAVKGILLHIRNVADRKESQSRIRRHAFFDVLTGLPGKTIFLDRVSQAADRMRRIKDYRYALLFVDLDRFRIVSEGLGHIAGDEAIRMVASLLSGFLGKSDTLCRLERDEFLILLDAVGDNDSVVRIAEDIQGLFSEPIHVDGSDIFISASIGIAYGSCEYRGPYQIVRDAETALCRAKTERKGNYRVFDSSMQDQAVKRLTLETDLRNALNRKEFVLHYQPVVDLENNCLVGLEALVRWLHPRKGLIPPMEFIPLAEETGLIVPLGLWVLQEACHGIAGYIRNLSPATRFSLCINISVRQFLQGDLIAEIRRITNEAGIHPARLKLEVTESIMMDSSHRILSAFETLKNMGICLAIDDFGSGYSSLSYLHQFPFDTLKIDRSFVSRMGMADDKNSKIIQTIMVLASHLKMDVIAEGIETRFQIESLKALKCPCGQGFYLSRPMEAEQVRQFFSSQKAFSKPMTFDETAFSAG